MINSIKDIIKKTTVGNDRNFHRLYKESVFFMVGLFGKLIRFFIRPSLPDNTDGKTFLHLGCGEMDAPGFINIDAIPRKHVHYVRPIENLKLFKNESIDFIFASHCLEHFSHRDVPYVLKEWYRVLKKGGVLCLSVPDFDTIVNIYQDNDLNVDSIMFPLMGGQDYKFNYHKTAFTHESLSCLLIQTGFSSADKWIPYSDALHSIDGWANKQIKKGGKAYMISLNLEGVK